MKRLVPALAAALLMLGLSQGAILAADPGHIDQENAVGAADANSGGHQFAQTITVGETGKFSSVDLWLGGSGSVTVHIEAVDGSDNPTGSPLATGTASVPGSPGWKNFAFASPLAVASGQRLAIVFTTGAGSQAYGSDNGADTYTRGIAYWFDTQTSAWATLSSIVSAPSDLAFRTYVDPDTSAKVPSPTAMVETSPAGGGGIALLLPIGLLAASGGFFILVSRRRRSQLS